MKRSNKSRKDPGIPANLPFKDQVLAEVEQAKERKVVEREENRMAAMVRNA